MKRVLGVLLVMLAASTAIASLQDQFDATCRVQCGSGSGSGCAYSADENYVAVITAAHVVEGQQAVTCEFWRAGHQSAKLPGQVLLADKLVDTAIIAVPRAAFGQIEPALIPLGQPGDVPNAGETIQSVGCAGGAWATGWQGHVTKAEGGRIYFVPPPAGGRSGSVITNSTGDKIVGVLQIRTNDGEGGATSIAAIRARMERQMSAACAQFQPDSRLTAYLAQCPGGQCPLPGSQRNPNGGRYLLPWNVPESRGGAAPPSGGTNPWPTLPVAPPKTETIPVPTPAAPDPRVDQAIGLAGQANQKVDSLGQAFNTLGQKVQGVSDAVDEVKGAIKPLTKIHDKLEADAEAGGIKGKIAQKILDKFEGDGTSDTRLDRLHHILITAGVIIGILCVVGLIHWLRTGHGLVAEAVKKAAERHPENQGLQQFSARLLEKEEALREKLPIGKLAGGVVAGPVGAAVGGAVDLAQQVRDLQARLHELALNTPAPGQTGVPQVAPATPPVNVTFPAK